MMDATHATTAGGDVTGPQFERAVKSHLGAGRLSDAVGLLTQWLRDDPDHPEACSLMGVVAGRNGDDASAAGWFAKSVAASPDDPHHHRNHALALIRSGRLEDAAAALRSAGRAHPGDPHLLRLRGVVASRCNDLSDAVECFRKIVGLCPDDAAARYEMGEVLRRSGDVAGATAAWKECLRLNPEHFDALNNLAGVQLAGGDFVDGLTTLQRVLNLRPDWPRGHANLAVAMHAAGDLRQAVVCLRNALRLDPSLEDARFRMVNHLITAGKLDDASEELDRWRSNRPDDERLTALSARLLERRGKIDRAWEVFDSIPKDRRDSAHVRTTRAVLADAAGDPEQTIRILDGLVGENPDAIDQIAIRFLMGKSLDRTGRHDDAFEHFRRGNELRRRGFVLPYDRERTRRTFAEVADRFRRLYLDTEDPDGSPRRSSTSDFRPIFIVGMPRSGTSLIEQILSRHPTVRAAGELTALSDAVADGMGDEPGGSTPPAVQGSPFEIVRHRSDAGTGPLLLSAFDDETLDRVGDGYRRRALANLHEKGHNASGGIDDDALIAGSIRMSDKMPYNFLFVPLIRRVFPRATIIHARRDGRDSCLSCYFQNFTGGNEFAFDLDDLTHYYEQYRAVVGSWSDLPSIDVVDADYESLVTDPGAEIRRLIQRCGLDWHDDCLTAHLSDRAVATASYQQVRQPIHSRSIGRWRVYRRHLEPHNWQSLAESPVPDSTGESDAVDCCPS